MTTNASAFDQSFWRLSPTWFPSLSPKKVMSGFTIPPHTPSLVGAQYPSTSEYCWKDLFLNVRVDFGLSVNWAELSFRALALFSLMRWHCGITPALTSPAISRALHLVPHFIHVAFSKDPCAYTTLAFSTPACSSSPSMFWVYTLKSLLFLFNQAKKLWHGDGSILPGKRFFANRKNGRGSSLNVSMSNKSSGLAKPSSYNRWIMYISHRGNIRTRTVNDVRELTW